MKAIRPIFYFIIGAIVLSSFSTFQKLLSGFPIKINGYYIPILFGGAVAIILGLFYQRIKNQRNNLININKDLVKAKEKAEENEKLKSAFLANVSHELLTPLNGIIGFAKLLIKNGENTRKRKQYVSLITRSGERMHSTVRELVEISKIEAGQLKMNINTIDVREQVTYLYSIFHKDATDKGLNLIFNKGNHYSNKMITDKEKLCTIIMNILKNSIKYTDKGTITFDCSSTENEIFYKIEDTGIGIPKNRQKAVFERFVQADIMDKDAREGVGLGLAISKAYIDLLQGSIKLESEESKGTCIKINIPIEREKGN